MIFFLMKKQKVWLQSKKREKGLLDNTLGNLGGEE
jgi:hypothetical protein